ncbi:MAG TPA: Crp/Fnr family transcriptional regulator [Pseudomonadales bacterium]|nr:Crp/Fnr family transcriptional regulator [Pseudomonadales bacterium]
MGNRGGPSTGGPTRNLLLAALPADVLERLLPHLDLVPLELGQVIYEPGQSQAHVYFPTTAIVSLLCGMENGTSVETSVVGFDGFVGLAVFLGGDRMTHRAVVQCKGEGYRCSAKHFRDENWHMAALHRALLFYAQALITQTTQTAVCNRFHTLEQQLCRWLLLTHDLMRTDELVMTQELIADNLGVRREGVSVAAHRLQETGLIRYRRGHISILDRAGLERAVCECYGVVRRECDRLLLHELKPRARGL